MDPYPETFETWNQFAGLYQEKFMHLDIYNSTYDDLCGNLKKGAKVLELGCGPGNISRQVLNRRADLQLLGIDVAPAMIDLARRNNPEARFEVMDIRKLNEFSPGYDGIIAGFCIPYLLPQDAREMIFSSGALLNHNGIFYLSYVEGAASRSGWQQGSTGQRSMFHYYPPGELSAWMKDCGFEMISEQRIPYTTREVTDMHVILMCRKTRHD